MSASTPGLGSERRRTASPDNDLDARGRALSVLDRIEKRTSISSTDSLNMDDSMNKLSSGAGTRTMMSASTPGGNTRGRGSFHNSFHSSVAKRFLVNPGEESDESDEFDLQVGSIMGVSKYGAASPSRGPTSTKSRLGGASKSRLGSLQRDDSFLGRLSDSLHSLTGMGESTSMLTGALGGRDYDDEMQDLDQDLSSSDEQEIHFEKSLFSNRLRQDLTQVDQSVNLMNAEAGKYDVSMRGYRKRGKKDSNASKTMVEMFLSEKTSANQRGICECGVLCLLTIFIAVVAAAFLLTPFFEDLKGPAVFTDTGTANSLAPTPATTTEVEVATNPPEVATEPPVAEDDTSLSTTKRPTPSSSLTSPFFEREEVQQREQALEELLAAQPEGITTNTVAARKANAWIVAYDPAQLDLEEDDGNAVLQRYALAVLFFVAHPDSRASTAPHGTAQTRQSKSLGDNNEKRRDLSRLSFVDWMTASHVCWWEGVGCNPNEDKQVAQIHLAESHIYGTLPPELGMLPELEQLDMSHNRLQGEVPLPWAESLGKLEILQLHDNQLTGTVPTEFCQLGALDTFTTDCSTTDMECECCSECL